MGFSLISGVLPPPEMEALLPELRLELELKLFMPKGEAVLGVLLLRRMTVAPLTPDCPDLAQTPCNGWPLYSYWLSVNSSILLRLDDLVEPHSLHVVRVSRRSSGVPGNCARLAQTPERVGCVVCVCVCVCVCVSVSALLLSQ